MSETPKAVDYVEALSLDLRAGVSSDIWFDPQFGEEDYAKRIEVTQLAMEEAAQLLPELTRDIANLLAVVARLKEGRELSDEEAAIEVAQLEAAEKTVAVLSAPYEEAAEDDALQPKPY